MYEYILIERKFQKNICSEIFCGSKKNAHAFPTQYTFDSSRSVLFFSWNKQKGPQFFKARDGLFRAGSKIGRRLEPRQRRFSRTRPITNQRLCVIYFRASSRFQISFAPKILTSNLILAQEKPVRRLFSTRESLERKLLSNFDSQTSFFQSAF